MTVRPGGAPDHRLGSGLPAPGAPPRGGGWDSLPDRCRTVAMLMAQGLPNAEIAARLGISEHTVRHDASRVLAAYELSSRTGLVAVLAALLPPVPQALPELTLRQHQVAELVAKGRRNAEIATALGISEGTVEHHVGNILRKWRLSTRTEIAAVLASRGPEGA